LGLGSWVLKSFERMKKLKGFNKVFSRCEKLQKHMNLHFYDIILKSSSLPRDEQDRKYAQHQLKKVL
jgi:hypothetical protein